jgi:ABC-type transport system substrate-binding protein
MTGEEIVEIEVDRRTFVASAASLTGVALAGCAGGDADEGTEATTETSGGGGGTATETATAAAADDGTTTRLTVAVPSEVWNLDPALWTDTGSSIVGQLIYDELVGLDTDEQLRPGLAESVPDPVDDGTAYEYTLREGLTFHSGDPVTIEDVKYSVDWILNPDNNSPIRGRLPFVTDTEIVGDRTIRLNLEQPFGSFNRWLTRGLEGVVPEGSRGGTQEGKGPSGLATNLTKDPSGAGTGPFQFSEWRSGEYVRLEAFDDYWMEGVPKVDEVEFQFISEDATRLANLRNGNVDLTNRVPPKDFEEMQNTPNVVAESVPGNATTVLYTNLMDTGDNPMSNVNNRRAVMFAVDAAEILDEVFYGQGVVQKGPWYPDSEWTSPKLRDMELYDPEKARAELEKAGNPDGFEMDLMVAKELWFRDVGVIVQNQLSKIGVDASIVAVDKSTFFNQMYGTGQWHAGIEGWWQAVPDVLYWLDAGFADNGHNHNQWHHPSDDLPDNYLVSGPPAPESASGDYSNGHEWYVDRLQEAQASTDVEKQKEIVYELEEYIVENAIQIDLAYSNKLEAWRDRVSGYEVGSFVDEYRNVSVE